MQIGNAGLVVADRVFNIVAITEAAMGQFSVANTEQEDGDANRLVFYLQPANAKGGLFRAELKVIARSASSPSPSSFHVLETVRQTVTSVSNVRMQPLVKDVETISLYEQITDTELRAQQRTRMFLVPSDPYQKVRWEQSQGKAVDVRKYDVFYTSLS